MGCFNLADAVTGRAIARGDRVVALLLDRRTGGYPDAVRFSMRGGTDATNHVEPASLPVFGEYDDYGGIEPDWGQLSVLLACTMTGASDWDTLQGEIVLDDVGFRPNSDRSLPSDADAEPHHLGLSLMHKATWDRVRTVGRRNGLLNTDVSVVREAMIDAAQRMRENVNVFQFYDVLHLQGSTTLNRNGKRVHLPPLARALAHREGGDVVAPVFSDWLRHASGRIGTDLVDRIHVPGALDELETLLRGLDDLICFETGLEILGQTLRPSPFIGQEENDVEILEMAMDNAFDSGGRLMERIEEWGGTDTPQVQALENALERMDALRASLAKRLAEARAAE